MQYNETVKDHFTHPRNAGVIPQADGEGEAGNLTCGDLIRIFIRVKDHRLEEVTFQTIGCGAAIASSSMLTVLAKGKTLEEALTITRETVAEALGGLPATKAYCSNLAADALHQAIQDYKRKTGHLTSA
jgi:nitrogen fixation NifU-like protein